MVSEDSSDEELIEAVIAGQTQAYRFLVERYQPMLFGLVVRQVQNNELAEEICQESFVKAYLSLKQFRFAAKFSTWLTRIGLNQVHSYFSSRKFREQKFQESFEVEKHELAVEGSESANSAETKLQQFKIALAQLKPKFRDVIVLCSLEEKSYEEAAQILEVPIGTIRSRLNTARLMIRDILIKEFSFEGGHEA